MARTSAGTLKFEWSFMRKYIQSVISWQTCTINLKVPSSGVGNLRLQSCKWLFYPSAVGLHGFVKQIMSFQFIYLSWHLFQMWPSIWRLWWSCTIKITFFLSLNISINFKLLYFVKSVFNLEFLLSWLLLSHILIKLLYFTIICF